MFDAILASIDAMPLISAIMAIAVISISLFGVLFGCF